ncbi:5'-3' exonuclease [Micromonospora craniellae]|uniref:5'-3' exonuclease n=1 Tax=Micromonospora craniellae TaxID=2294034 RepID=UPI0018F109B1|nr:5'-3' exonuclease H3TH domain-containing protein [Micromonospora craniellae]
MTGLFLVDGHQLLYRAWFGFPARITSRDKTRDLTGVFGFLALMRKAHRLHAPDHELVVVFDGEHAAARRAAAVPGYKANRAGADHTPIASLPDVKRALDAAAVRWTEIDQMEADDVIATATTSAVHAGRSVVCYSSDRDFYQLLQPTVTVLTPRRTFITAADIHHRYCIHPCQWPDCRALTGDPADNIPGIRGIGPTTAANLLTDGWHLDQLPDSPRLRNPRCHPITHQWTQLLAWRDAIRLRTDIPLPDTLITGQPTAPLPRAAHLLDQLHLW